MSEKHTPGPWHTPAIDMIVCPMGHVATTCYLDKYMEGSRKANARLIAAAPDLLAALDAAMEIVGFVEAGEKLLQGREHTVRCKFEKGHAIKAGNVIRAAIAKADPLDAALDACDGELELTEPEGKS